MGLYKLRQCHIRKDNPKITGESPNWGVSHPQVGITQLEVKKKFGKKNLESYEISDGKLLPRFKT